MQTIDIKSSQAFFDIFQNHINTYLSMARFAHTPSDDHESITLHTKTYDLPVRIGTLIDNIANIVKENDASHLINFEDASLDTHTFTFTHANGEAITLTEKECQILTYLNNNKGKMVSREDLLHSIWNYAQDVETHTLETHIYRLRQKIEDNPSKPKIIKTLDKGYTL
ncbi:MAG: winged helix-turn-helix domain-containing protein [Alphaproteobacteria bacterium]